MNSMLMMAPMAGYGTGPTPYDAIFIFLIIGVVIWMIAVSIFNIGNKK